MILQSLIEYAERRRLSEDEAFSPKKVYWQIELDSAGRFLDAVPLGQQEKKHRGEDILAPDTPQNLLNGGKISHFLVDSAERVLLWREADTDESKTKKLGIQHVYYWNLIEECARTQPIAKALLGVKTSLPAVIAAMQTKKAKPSQNIIFAIAGARSAEDAGLRTFWKDRRAKFLGEGVEQSSLELASGTRMSGILESHGPIRGLRGGNPSGTMLICNDKAAFQSFGLENSLNAPVSSTNAAKYRAALSDLIRKGKTLSEATVCFWTRSGEAFDPWTLVGEADAEQVRLVLNAPRGGDRAAVNALSDHEAFYALALSGVGGRAMVRSWMESTVTDVRAAVRKWFEDIEIVGYAGDSPAGGHKLFALLYALCREKLEELPPQLPVDLIQAALDGGPAPAALLGLAIRRHGAAVHSTDEKERDKAGKEMRRVALMRLCLVRSASEPEVNHMMKPKLDPDQNDPAYLCGRLLAVFDRLQYLALGDVGAGVVERTYGAASATPAVVYGRIFRNAQNHLSKLSHSEGGTATNIQKDPRQSRAGVPKPNSEGGTATDIQKDLEDITSGLGQWPQTLSLEEQARFALGFYHQKAAYRQRSQERKQEKLSKEMP